MAKTKKKAGLAQEKATAEKAVPKKSPKDIVIKETEDDVMFDGTFNTNPEEFKDEIKKEAEKADVFAKFIVPVLVFLAIGSASAAATWYYAKPEHTAAPSTENKIQTPPKVEETPTAQTPAAPAPAPAQPQVQTYTVQEGDTMSGIANKYGMTSTELANYNAITDVNSLHIGQVLKIPAK